MKTHAVHSSKHPTRSCTPIERLEGRLLMAANSWKSPVSGDWDDATKWSAGHVPTATEDAVINLAGTYSVTHAKINADSVHSVVSTHALNLSLGSLNVATTINVSAAFTIGGGKLLHATVNGTGPTFSGRTSGLDGVTLNSDAVLPNGAMVSITHGLTFQNNHSITLQRQHERNRSGLRKQQRHPNRRRHRADPLWQLVGNPERRKP